MATFEVAVCVKSIVFVCQLRRKFGIFKWERWLRNVTGQLWPHSYLQARDTPLEAKAGQLQTLVARLGCLQSWRSISPLSSSERCWDAQASTCACLLLVVRAEKPHGEVTLCCMRTFVRWSHSSLPTKGSEMETFFLKCSDSSASWSFCCAFNLIFSVDDLAMTSSSSLLSLSIDLTVALCSAIDFLSEERHLHCTKLSIAHVSSAYFTTASMTFSSPSLLLASCFFSLLFLSACRDAGRTP